MPVSGEPAAMTARVTTRNPFTLLARAVGEPGPVASLEVATVNGQAIVTPFRSHRSDAVRAKLAELDLTARDVRDAVSSAREAMSTSRAKGRRAPDDMAAAHARSAPPRIVVDTDLVLSALVTSGGAPAALRRGWQRRRFIPLASKAMVDELMGGLARPRFALTTDEQEDLLFDYLFFCKFVELPIPPSAIPTGLNPFDVSYLVLAIAGGASCLVADDRELLGLHAELPCPIFGADDFLAQLEPG